jgi:hypothetical protein
MPSQTPEQFISSMKKSGLFVVMDDKYYFIPLSTMSQCQMPDAFQKGTKGISNDYFAKENPGGASATEIAATQSLIFNRLDHHLGAFAVADGVSQAIWLDAEAEVAGKHVSKSEHTKQILFCYGGPGNKKIVVDMSKGGRPSTG